MLSDGTVVEGEPGPYNEPGKGGNTAVLPPVPEGYSKSDIVATVHNHNLNTSISEKGSIYSQAAVLSDQDKSTISNSNIPLNLVVGYEEEAGGTIDAVSGRVSINNRGSLGASINTATEKKGFISITALKKIKEHQDGKWILYNIDSHFYDD